MSRHVGWQVLGIHLPSTYHLKPWPLLVYLVSGNCQTINQPKKEQTCDKLVSCDLLLPSMWFIIGESRDSAANDSDTGRPSAAGCGEFHCCHRSQCHGWLSRWSSKVVARCEWPKLWTWHVTNKPVGTGSLHGTQPISAVEGSGMPSRTMNVIATQRTASTTYVLWAHPRFQLDGVQQPPRRAEQKSREDWSSVF